MRLAVIPARGGSKRIPDKNIRSFCGRPMIAWSIEAAQRSGLFDRVIVSTDSSQVADVARACGAEVPFERPACLSDDHTGTLEVITHAARWAVDQELTPEAICCIYATAPFLVAQDLHAALAALAGGRWDYVFPAARFSQPVFRAFTRGNDGEMGLLFPEHSLTRSQDLPPVYHDAGQFYWGLTEAWLGERPIYGSRTTFIELPPERVQDIDTPNDWAMAEDLFRKFQKDQG